MKEELRWKCRGMVEVEDKNSRGGEEKGEKDGRGGIIFQFTQCQIKTC